MIKSVCGEIVNKEGEANMRRTDNTPDRPMIGLGPATFPKTNHELWVQFKEEPRNSNPTILEIVQELKSKVAQLQDENERLMLE